MLKNKGKVQSVIPKVVVVAYGSSRLQDLFITKFNSQFKLGFTEVFVNRAGRLGELLQVPGASTVEIRL